MLLLLIPISPLCLFLSIFSDYGYDTTTTITTLLQHICLVSSLNSEQEGSEAWWVRRQ